MNGQIVLCKDLNDKEELRRTLNDLLKYAPVMQSVSVVPVGLTRFRDGLYPLEPLTKEDALITLDIIEEVQKEALAKYDIHFAHASDELYVLAERDFPSEEEYDGYVQLENGVGMLRLLIEDYKAEEQRVRELIDSKVIDPYSVNKKISVATGMLVHPYIEKVTAFYKELFPGLELDIYAIRNDYFGESITVSGLITGGDLIAQLKDKKLGDILAIQECMLRSGETVFLDDVTLDEVEKTLQVKSHIVKSSVQDFTEMIVGNMEGA